MKNDKFSQYLDLYNYVYRLGFTTYSFSREFGFGLKFGVLEHSTITGEAQEMLLTVKDLNEEVKSNITSMNNAEFSKWVLNRPVSLNGTFFAEYKDTFEGLIAGTVKAQKKAIFKITEEWEVFINKVIGKQLPDNIEALSFARFLRRDFTFKDQEKAAMAYFRNGLSALSDVLNIDEYTNVYLTMKRSYVPDGRQIDIVSKFSWLKVTDDNA